jgi:uncharacterized 2Fe-2S/4Fe-4S cluster protein (DUF4445 family)
MVTVHFYPANRSISIRRGFTILDAARLAGVVIDSPCDGVETCGKCRVRLDEASLTQIVRRGAHHLSKDEEADGHVLACAAEIIGDIAVRIPENGADKSMKITSHGRKASVNLAPWVTKEYSAGKGVTSIMAGGRFIGQEEGDTGAESYGLVVDIGTTTLVVSLVDLGDGKELAVASALNPQSIHAQDVLSRIRFASEVKGLEEMRKGVIDEINRLTRQAAEETGLSQKRIYETVFSGNTCMLHLAAGVDPASLGRYPYTPLLTGGEYLDGAAMGLDISPFGIVYLPPVISAYVGADITSGILATRLHEERETTLFVDIGTNGEMAIARDGRLWSTSTAAGPAFEGMNISSGMRAGEGAIERFAIAADGEVAIGVIGGTDATGICGSGLLDIVAELVTAGVIAANGRFVSAQSDSIPEQLKERLVEKNGKTVFLINDKIWLTQKDIRQVQLAKGAVRAGIQLLLRHTGMTETAVEKVLIAGSFGYHLRAESLVAIGLLPPEFKDRIEFVGNTSKTGGETFLLNRDSREEMERLVHEVEVVELANCQDFDKVFVAALPF